jgi:hypothetical protein
MTKTALINAEAVAVIVAVSVPVHYLGLAWAWAVVAGAVTSIVLRRLIHGGNSHARGSDR